MWGNLEEGGSSPRWKIGHYKGKRGECRSYPCTVFQEKAKRMEWQDGVSLDSTFFRVVASSWPAVFRTHPDELPALHGLCNGMCVCVCFRICSQSSIRPSHCPNGQRLGSCARGPRPCAGEAFTRSDCRPIIGPRSAHPKNRETMESLSPSARALTSGSARLCSSPARQCSQPNRCQ